MKRKSIIFATSNKNKLSEAQSILGIPVEGTNLEIGEIQSLDPIKVAVAKSKAYYQKLQKPIFVEDTSLLFEGLEGLPGTYIDDFYKVLGNEGLTRLLDGKSREAVAQVTLVYIGGKSLEHIFIGQIGGWIAEEPRGKNGFGWDPIFIPEGTDKTFAEMNLREKNKYSMRKIALNKFKKWLRTQKAW